MGLPIAPSKKEIFDAIINSDPEHDWEKSYGNGLGSDTTYYRLNVNLRFETGIDDQFVQNDDFIAPWANKFPDQKARGYYYKLYYCSTHIDSFVLASVDGARANLPMPKNCYNDLTVDKLNMKVAQIFNNPQTLSEYLERSGLKCEV
jgi:hypothetical protein